MIQRRMFADYDWLLRTVSSLAVAGIAILALIAAGCGGGGGDGGSNTTAGVTGGTSSTTTTSGGTSGTEYNPVTSPNGGAIAYGRAKVRNGVEYGSDLWVKNGDGSNPRQVYQSQLYATFYVWSPGSDRIAFLHTKDERSGSLAIIGINGDGYRELRSTNEAAGFGEPIPESFSADGQRVQFRQTIDQGAQTARYTIGIDGTGLTRM